MLQSRIQQTQPGLLNVAASTPQNKPDLETSVLNLTGKTEKNRDVVLKCQAPTSLYRQKPAKRNFIRVHTSYHTFTP